MEGQEIIAYASGNEEIVPKSGIAGFDRALANSLARLTHAFDVLPGFGYYDEKPGENNAYATPAVRLERADGTVLFGTRMLQDLLQRHESPDAAVLAVCAHEYGHIVQYKYNLRDRLLANQNTVRKLELNADYFAGYFAGVRKLENSNFPAAVFANTQHSFGDFNTGSKGHHGTPNERAAAVVLGFVAAHDKRLTFQQAIEDGLAQVGA
ncbi:metalloprotease [Mesorhizobium sp.]|uniref:metalloprotease n=1 Tax=Mesorhizobium sp. TaxID=1871066 RepID=UPI00257F806B|nr:metalloprotease [Mesorhizobium sp.]